MGTKFTVKAIENAAPKKKRYYLREGRGFCLQVLPSGEKSFVYIYDLNGSRGYHLIGHFPDCSLAEARTKYNEAHDLVKHQKIDPRDHRKAEAERLTKAKEAARLQEEAAIRAAEAAARAAAELEKFTFDYILEHGVTADFTPTTVEQLAGAWFVLYSRVNHSEDWQKTVISCIRKHILPAFGNWEINSVRRKHATSLIETLAATVSGSARNTNKVARQIYNYACHKEWAEIQPFNEMVTYVPKIAPQQDERHLDDDEIVTAWKEITKSSSSDKVKRALKLILVTAQRPGEVAQMHRSQIKGRWWTIPADVARKGEREHRVYLTDTALALIGDDSGRIFHSGRSVSGYISENTLSQAINRGYEDGSSKVVGDNIIKSSKQKYFGMEPWSPHDLRRTARTNMARIGVLKEIAEEVINHKKPFLEGTYNKYTYDREKKEALLKWESFLHQILSEDVETAVDIAKLKASESCEVNVTPSRH